MRVGASAPDCASIGSPNLRAGETCRRGSLPITTPARTLLDLAHLVTDPTLAQAVHQADVLRLVRHDELSAVLAHHPLHPGASRLERARLELLDRHGLAAPKVNHRVLGYEIDFLWPAERLIAETDGERFHRTVQAFEADRRRDALLQAAGYHVFRFTYRQVTQAPDETLATVRALLERARRRGTPTR